MKQIINVTITAAIMLLVFANGALYGDPIPLTLNVQATAIVQGPSTTVGTVTKYTTTTVKITNQSLLYLIAQALSTTFPAGSKLVLESDGDVWVTDKDGTELEDLSTDTILYLVFPPARTPFIYTDNGQFDSSTGAEKDTENYVTYLIFDDGGDNSFICEGFTVEKFSLAAVKSGSQVGSDSLTITGSGEGYIGGGNTAISGKITGKGTYTYTGL